MAKTINTVKTITGNPTYGKTTGGYKNTIPELRKYDNHLLKFLTTGERLAHGKYLVHKAMPKQLGDTMNLRRYFDIEADPRKLKLDKNTIDGPELKELKGAAVEFKLEWFANGIDFNDVVSEIHLDNLMQIAMPRLMRNAKVVMDNIASMALYEGASKAFIKSYDATNGLKLGAAVGDVAGPLNHDVFRAIAKKFINNTETYVLSDGTTSITVPAKILPTGMKGKYRALVSDNGMDDLIDDKKFIDKFIKGIGAQELRDNKIVSTFRTTYEVIDNALHIEKSSGDLIVNGGGDLEVSFMFGAEFGADIKLGNGAVRTFVKKPNTVDSGDVYGRYSFVTYKLAYNVAVINSAAIYAIVYKPGTAIASGSLIDATTSVPTI